MSPIKMVAPGTDPLQTETPWKFKPQLPWKWIAAFVVLMVVVFGPLLLKSVAAKKVEALTPTITATLAASPTPTNTPTQSGTRWPSGTLSAAFSNSSPKLATGQPTTTGTTPQTIQVTRIVQVAGPAVEVVHTQIVQVEITRLATQIITTTPLPTYTTQPSQTPWIVIVTRVVEVTSTPTATQKPIPTATDIIEIPTHTPEPNETQTVSRTPPLYPYP